jgi:hypothetical protein
MLYKQETGATEWTQYIRAHRLVVENPIEGMQSVVVSQQVVRTDKDGNVQIYPTGGLVAKFDDPTEEFNLPVPLSSGSTKATQQDVYIILAALVAHEREKIDEAETADDHIGSENV